MPLLKLKILLGLSLIMLNSCELRSMGKTMRRLPSYDPKYLGSSEYLTLRYRNNNGQPSFTKIRKKTNEIAIIVVDMWNKHHCKPSEKRAAQLAHKVNGLLSILRKSGVQVIFSPSDTVSYYANYQQRKKIQKIGPPSKNVQSLQYLALQYLDEFNFPPLNVSAGCEDPDQDEGGQPWTRQHDALKIEKNDVISDNGDEIINFLAYRKIDTVLFVGVHSNICILERSFGMTELKKWGFQTILIRDLTDSFSRPSNKFPTQEARNNETIKYIETYVGYTIHSSQIVSPLTKK